MKLISNLKEKYLERAKRLYFDITVIFIFNEKYQFRLSKNYQIRIYINTKSFGKVKIIF